MELPHDPEAYIEDSRKQRAIIQYQLSRLAIEHEVLLADELAILKAQSDEVR